MVLKSQLFFTTEIVFLNNCTYLLTFCFIKFSNFMQNCKSTKFTCTKLEKFHEELLTNSRTGILRNWCLRNWKRWIVLSEVIRYWWRIWTSICRVVGWRIKFVFQFKQTRVFYFFAIKPTTSQHIIESAPLTLLLSHFWETFV